VARTQHFSALIGLSESTYSGTEWLPIPKTRNMRIKTRSGCIVGYSEAIQQCVLGSENEIVSE